MCDWIVMLYEHASKSDDGDVVELNEFSLFSTLCIELQALYTLKISYVQSNLDFSNLDYLNPWLSELWSQAKVQVKVQN